MKTDYPPTSADGLVFPLTEASRNFHLGSGLYQALPGPRPLGRHSSFGKNRA